MQYTSIPQFDEEEFQSQHHQKHQHQDPSTSIPLSTATTTAAQHTHCELCDHQLERREKLRNQRHCCALVAATFMVAFVCVLLLGVAVVRGQRR